MLTKHAILRMKQRSINQDIIDLLLNYGDIEYHKGKQIYSLCQLSLKLLSSEIKELTTVLSKLNRVFVVAKGSIIITVGYRKNRFKKNR